MGKVPSKAKVLKALAHPVRLNILEALVHGPLRVNELVRLTRRRQPYISQHLGVLRRAGVIVASRKGASIYYQLDPFALKDTGETVCAVCRPLRDTVEPLVVGYKMMPGSKINAWHGIAREQIAWHPTIVAERCVGCGMCATSCERGVYAFDCENNRPVVVAPQMCMVGCTTCATLCLYDAIEFPSRGSIRQLVRERKVLRRSKDELRDQRDRYDVVRAEKGAASMAKDARLHWR
jgi:DNA-binding transcriptional ArsR family regulator/NAD-dependent dihydropyrimidine dehydrogenase PreA subunit